MPTYFRSVPRVGPHRAGSAPDVEVALSRLLETRAAQGAAGSPFRWQADVLPSRTRVRAAMQARNPSPRPMRSGGVRCGMSSSSVCGRSSSMRTTERLRSRGRRLCGVEEGGATASCQRLRRVGCVRLQECGTLEKLLRSVSSAVMRTATAAFRGVPRATPRPGECPCMPTMTLTPQPSPPFSLDTCGGPSCL